MPRVLSLATQDRKPNMRDSEKTRMRVKRDDPATRDMVKVITQHMSWYVEWPHVDGRFIAVFRTLPGHTVRHWWDNMDGMGE